MVLGRLEDADVTWNYVNAAIWSAAEPAMGVIAACIPSFRPLLTYLWKGTTKVSTLGSKTAQATTSSTSSRMMWSKLGKDDTDRPGRFSRLEEGHPGRWGHDTNIHGGRETGLGSDEENISLEEINAGSHGGIKVKNEVVITVQPWEYKDKLF